MESRKRGRKYCEHCDSLLANSTYYLHRSQFYDAESNVWRKLKDTEVPGTSSESDCEMEDDLEYYDCVGDNASGGEQFNFDMNPLWNHMVLKVIYEVDIWCIYIY